MIQVARFARSLRYALRDAGKNKVSDYEILDAINTALDALYAECAELGVRSTQNTIILTLESGSASLPWDYSSMVGVWAGSNECDGNRLAPAVTPDEDLTYKYFVSGNKIKTGTGEEQLFLRYHAAPPEIGSLDGVIDLPGSMSLPLRYMALASIQMDLENLIGLARNAAGRMAESAWGELPDKAGLI